VQRARCRDQQALQPWWSPLQRGWLDRQGTPWAGQVGPWRIIRRLVEASANLTCSLSFWYPIRRVFLPELNVPEQENSTIARDTTSQPINLALRHSWLGGSTGSDDAATRASLAK